MEHQFKIHVWLPEHESIGALKIWESERGNPNTASTSQTSWPVGKGEVVHKSRSCCLVGWFNVLITWSQARTALPPAVKDASMCTNSDRQADTAYCALPLAHEASITGLSLRCSWA